MSDLFKSRLLVFPRDGSNVSDNNEHIQMTFVLQYSVINIRMTSAIYRIYMNELNTIGQMGKNILFR